MINREGLRFGRLTILRCVERGRHQCAPKWECRCDCGNTVILRYAVLKNGHTQSCGCLRSEQTMVRSTKHGSSHSRLYQVWQDMKKRCSNSSYPGWKDYGGRGITYCNEWEEYEPFQSWALSNGYINDLFIDRRDNNGNYCPENCRFVTRQVQNNNKGNHVLLTHQGITKNIQQWADELMIHRETLFSRIRRGWPIEKALTHPRMKNQFH